MPLEKLKKNMDYDSIDDILQNPVKSLEIDTKQPEYQLDEILSEEMIMDSRSLDVSYGGRSTEIIVYDNVRWNK